MAEILIRNMEMPKDGNLELTITPKGEILFGDCHFTYNYGKKVEAIELPPHGRLIDEADLRDRAYKRQIRDRISFHDALVLALMDAPTIIEAST